MGLIPMHYETAYAWTGDGVAGDIAIAGHDTLPVGSPHDAARFSPEHMLVAAAESCLANYTLLFARMSGLEIAAYRSTAEGSLVEEGKANYRFERIVVRPEVTVAADRRETAERILAKAHGSCLVARSLTCPVEMEATVNTVD